jgi:hypothetical protein
MDNDSGGIGGVRSLQLSIISGKKLFKTTTQIRKVWIMSVEGGPDIVYRWFGIISGCRHIEAS